MRCPFCGHEESQVKDSRPSEDGSAIRRRRQCPNCGGRFTTFERVQLREITIIKSNGSREPFDRDKLHRSLNLSLRKRPVAADRIEQVVNSITRQLETMGESEVESRVLGAMVMEVMKTLDTVGYVRYASVYKDFREPQDFNEFVDSLQKK
ncbi:MAG: transcriptional regulator NrdR [Bdellovibrionales bacterium]